MGKLYEAARKKIASLLESIYGENISDRQKEAFFHLIEENIQEDQNENTTETIEVNGQEYTPEELAKQYKEATSKLSERNEKAKNYEEMQKFFEQDPNAAQILQAYAQNPQVAQYIQKINQDPNAQTLIEAYEQGMINHDQLNEAKRYLQKNQPVNNQQNPNQPQQFNQQPNQQADPDRKIQALRMEMNMRRNFDKLESDYSDIIEEHDLDVEKLGNYAVNHNITDDNGNYDMRRALNHYVADNNDVFEALQNMAKNDVQKQQQQQKRAQVEKPSQKQNQKPAQEEESDPIIDGMMQYTNASGGGVT